MKMNSTTSKTRARMIGLTIFVLCFGISSIAKSDRVMFMPDCSAKGSSLRDNQAYIVAEEAIVSTMEKLGHKVVLPVDIPRQYLPRRRRPDANDWFRVFERGKPPTDLLVTLTLLNHVDRNPRYATVTVYLSAEIYTHGKKKSVEIIDLGPSKTRRLSPQCFAACLMKNFADIADEPAVELAKKVVDYVREYNISKKFK